MPREIAGVDEIELEQDVGVTVFGFDVPLGVGHVRLPVVAGDVDPVSGQPGLVRVSLRPLADDSVTFTLTPPDGREAYKRTLAEGERPDGVAEAVWPLEWTAGEHEVSRDLRAGHGIRFVTEDAFFDWLANPGAAIPR